MMTTLFEVITEGYDGEEVTETRRYVTNDNNSLQEVAEYYTKECESLGDMLKSVRDVLNIVNNVPSNLIQQDNNNETD